VKRMVELLVDFIHENGATVHRTCTTSTGGGF
jgi:hypothetical protein